MQICIELNFNFKFIIHNFSRRYFSGILKKLIFQCKRCKLWNKFFETNKLFVQWVNAVSMQSDEETVYKVCKVHKVCKVWIPAFAGMTYSC